MLEEHRKQTDVQLVPEKQAELQLSESGRQFLVFRIDQQEMLIAVEDIREIILPTPISFLPNSAPGIEGVTALCGEILPVVNLRRLLGFGRIGITQNTRYLLVSSNDKNFTFIVDEIFDFVRLENHEIESLAKGYLCDEFKVVRSVSRNSNTARPILEVELIAESIFIREQCNEQSPH